MNAKLSLNLRFNVQTSNGTVTGYGTIATFVDGGLPRIGDRIMPWTGQTDINFITEYYHLEVIAVCRLCGGDFNQKVFCEVRLSTWSINTGRPVFYERTVEQVKDDWKSLKINYKDRAPYNKSSGSGISIVTLHFY